MTEEVNAQPVSPAETLNTLFRDACCELFSAYGLELQLQEAGQHEPGHVGYVTILSATGENIRLLSTLNIESALLSSMHPNGSAQVLPRDLEDWCSELNNQLVGRLKNKLLRLGCEVMVGLPSLITGKDITMISQLENDLRSYFFASALGSLDACLAMQFQPDFGFCETLAQSENEFVSFEGEHILF